MGRRGSPRPGTCQVRKRRVDLCHAAPAPTPTPQDTQCGSPSVPNLALRTRVPLTSTVEAGSGGAERLWGDARGRAGMSGGGDGGRAEKRGAEMSRAEPKCTVKSRNVRLAPLGEDVGSGRKCCEPCPPRAADSRLCTEVLARRALEERRQASSPA